MSYLDWKVGDKIVCVDNSTMEGLLALGEIYTIKFMTPEFVHLAEKSAYGTGGNSGYYYRRFRPVQTRKTDIAIFQRLLTNPKVKIEEDA